VGCADDDVGDGGRDADLDARVALLGQLALEELVELGVENTVCAVLAMPCVVLIGSSSSTSSNSANCAEPFSTIQCSPVPRRTSASGKGCTVPATNFLRLELCRRQYCFMRGSRVALT
jgi:hypothetical protein